MQDQTPIDRESELRSYRSVSNRVLRDIATGGSEYRPDAIELAQQVLDERERFDRRTQTELGGFRNSVQSDPVDAPVYPERFGTMVAVMLDDKTLDVIRLSFMEQIDNYVHWLNVGLSGEYWATELWAIDRACRVLGIE
jgi:hypothetical protein